MAKVARRGWIFGWVWYTLGRNHRECRHNVHTTISLPRDRVLRHDVGIKTDHFGVPEEGKGWSGVQVVSS